MKTLAELTAQIGRLLFNQKPMEMEPKEVKMLQYGQTVTCAKTNVPHGYSPETCSDPKAVTHG